VEKYGRDILTTDDNITRRMRFAYWITMATDTLSQYVILIAFPRQQRLHERASVSRYTYTACLVSFPKCPMQVAIGRLHALLARVMVLTTVVLSRWL
jgi:hypothetical protein